MEGMDLGFPVHVIWGRKVGSVPGGVCAFFSMMVESSDPTLSHNQKAGFPLGTNHTDQPSSKDMGVGGKGAQGSL